MKAGPSHPAAATALECAGAHLASWALRCIEPHVLPMAPALELLERLWRSGRYPPLLWVHDLLALVAGGEVGLPPGLEPEAAPRAWRAALTRLYGSAALRRLQAQRPGWPAIATAVGRLLSQGEPAASLALFRPPAGQELPTAEAVRRGTGTGGTFDVELLQPPDGLWEKVLASLDLEELRLLDQLGDPAIGLPGCLTGGVAVEVLPESVRAVLGALLRLLPREVRPGRQRGKAAALAGFGGYGEIVRKGGLDQLLPSEHAFRAALPARLIQGEALYYGRESHPPQRHEATWLLLDASAAMLGDPLLLARAIGVAAARLARRRVEFAFFDEQLGPWQTIERPADLWQLIHGRAALPPPAGQPLPGTQAVWPKLLRRLRARGEAAGQVHLVVISHEFLGAEEEGTVVQGLQAIAEEVDLRLVMIEFPDLRHHAPSQQDPGFERWMWLGPTLIPARPPWKVLAESGVPVAKIPVTRLWEAGD